MTTRTPSRDRLEHALADASSPRNHAIFTQIYGERARRTADAADARHRASQRLGPLDGKLVTIKDLFDVAGEPTTAGSHMLRDAAPSCHDALVVQRLRNAGAIIVGKTNMTEFAYSGIGINPHWGTPVNTVCAERVPGGSSSGAGVSVANGLADIAIGSDTGGSVRIPAALNGVAGFKPTAARIPLDGVFGLSRSLDSVGVLGHSVADCAAADAILAGEDPVWSMPASLAGVRFSVVTEFLEGADQPVAGAFEWALRRLQGASARVGAADVSLALDVWRGVLAHAPIVAVEAAALHAQRIEQQAAQFDPSVLRRIRRGLDVSGPAYADALWRRQSLIASVDQQFDAFDFLVAPTTAIVAPRFAEVDETASFDRINALLLRNTGFANFSDLCAISVALPHDALPVGLMLMGRRGADQALLQVARAVEACLQA
jgi:aspartyl-tRNA(Asn)/glutamyl-tRNA(Gln) amidotransferase subunit A